MQIYEELVARGLIAQVTNEEEIKKLVNEGKAVFYIGFDPTADSLHVGHFMALCLMKRLQMAGNKPIALLGGGTGMIGDPSGRTDMRQMLTPETIQHNCDCFKKQMSRFIDFSDDKALLVNNAEWLMNLNYASTHGGIGVQDGLRLMKPADRRRVSVVGMDQWSAMADVMHLVVEYGHRSVLYFAGPKEWRDAATRLLAWNKLCAANAVNSVTVQCETWESSEAYGKMNHILDNIGRTGGNLPTCMVCANDSQAVGVARALHEHGVRIPQDVSLVGFDDMPAMDNMFPPLTTVRPGFEQLGVAAMRETLYLLGAGEENSFGSSQHGVGLVSAQMVNRSSLGPVRRR